MAASCKQTHDKLGHARAAVQRHARPAGELRRPHRRHPVHRSRPGRRRASSRRRSRPRSARGEVSEAAVFDTDYVPMPGTNPTQWETGFCAWADAHVRPVLDRFRRADPRHMACVMSDINGYLPTHISDRSHAAGAGSGLERRALPQPPQLHRRRHPARDRQRQGGDARSPTAWTSARAAICRSRTSSCRCASTAAAGAISSSPTATRRSAELAALS